MAKARKKASKRRSKAKKNPVIDYGEGWVPSEAGRWAKTASRAEIEERLALVRAEIESPSSDDPMYSIYLYGDEGMLEKALRNLPHHLRQEPKPISGEFESNPKRRKRKAKKKASKRRSKAKKNPALVSAIELSYFYEDGIRDFNGSSLVGQDLSEMDLRDATFRNANLYSVSFQDSDLRGVDFKGADLGDTDFRGAKVDIDTLFEAVNMQGSQGPPQYYRGDVKISPEEMFGKVDISVEPFRVEVSDGGYTVAVDPGSGMAGAIKPEFYEGPNAQMKAVERARSLNREAEEIIGPEAPMDEGEAERVRSLLTRVKSMEPNIRGQSMKEVGAAAYRLLEKYGSLDVRETPEVLWYGFVRPATAPLYIQGDVRFDDPDDIRKFLDGLAELGLRMHYSKSSDPKPLIPLDDLDADAWFRYLNEYNNAQEQLENWQRNPRKRKAKTPEWKRLIDHGQKLWEKYDEKPLKKHLVAFSDHIEKMKEHTSARVRGEARRATRAVNAEFKARGWKKPASNPKKKPKKKATKRRRRNPGVSDSVVEAKADRYRQSLESVRGDEVARGMWAQIMGARQEITSFARDWSRWRENYGEYYAGWNQENFQYYDTLLPTIDELRSWNQRQVNPKKKAGRKKKR